MRFLNKRTLLAVFSVALVVMLTSAITLVYYLESPQFNDEARRYVINEIAKRTGAQVDLQALNWNFWQQRFWLENLTLQGSEPPNETPLAHFERIDIGLNLRTLLQRQINLFELTLTRPQFHIIVGPDGKTNLPAPVSGANKPFEFQISIQNFNILGGAAQLNERQVNLDFSVANIAALLSYQSTREVLQAHLRYDGTFERPSAPSIPYTLAADMDYTRATLLANRINIKSDRSELNLQGKINQLLTSDILGRLEYTGKVDVPFLNYFFANETFAGNANVAGYLEFARGYFVTRGTSTSRAFDYDGWHATNFTGQYAYRYPDRKLTVEKMKSQIAGGSVSGGVVIEHLPGPARVTVNVDYDGVDAAELARVYPWDPKYRIFSKMTGTLNGWFEGKMQAFDFAGHANFNSYNPDTTAGLVPLPLDGSTDYHDVRPGQVRVENSRVRFLSTNVEAGGLIHEATSDLKVKMLSSDLRDLAFLYSDANGSGSFDGVLTGAISKPTLEGEFTLQNHRYREWNIERAAGGVRLDTRSELAELRNTRITQGQSQVLVNGTAGLSGSPVDLRVRADRVTGPDLRVFLKRDVAGFFSGDIHLSSFSPLRFEGDIQADDLAFDGHLVGDAAGHVRYMDPTVEIEKLSIKRDQATLLGTVTLNPSTKALKFSGRANNIDLSTFRSIGLPGSLSGFIRQADLRADGTTTQPNLRGNAVIQNLAVYGQSFPQARVDLSSTGSRLDVALDAGRNVNLKAQIDTAAAGYPFTSQATFAAYPLEKLAGSDATLIVTGNADLAGALNDQKRLRGQGRIDVAEVHLGENVLRVSNAFTFDFNSDRVVVSGVTLTGPATQVNLGGTIGIAERAPLNLDVTGRLDLSLIAATYPEWFSSGAINVDGRIAGTLQNPDLRGYATLVNASFGRRGIFTSISNVGGNLFFDQDRITLNNIRGSMGGGTVQAQGTALLERRTVQAMNIRIETDNVRVRYPEGLRTVVNGTLVLRGALDSPLLEGNLQIQSLSYRSDFEQFLALITERGGSTESTPLGRLRLALHVEGSRNITIQNQLAEVEARIDVDVKGSVDHPSLTGHIEASGGTLLFQGNRYTITRGNIDFVDPVRIEPIVDVQAESEVRDYRVILSITGRGDRLHLDLRSDPPLPELEIVSLIAGGQTREELAARPNTAVPTSEQLFQRGAASILFDLLQERVGNRLGLFGLNRVRIDPFLVGAENNPGARITLSEQVTKDLAITYSQDLASNRQQIILIEYFVSRNTSVVASRDDLGNLGLDVRRRTRF